MMDMYVNGMSMSYCRMDSYKLQLELYESSLGLLKPDLLSPEFNQCMNILSPLPEFNQ